MHLIVEQHCHVLTEIVMVLNSHILKVIVGEHFPSSSADDHGRDVSNMMEQSKGKIRYCGAWAVAKVRNACREYFKANIYSANADVWFKANEAYGKSQLLTQIVELGN